MFASWLSDFLKTEDADTPTGHLKANSASQSLPKYEGDDLSHHFQVNPKGLLLMLRIHKEPISLWLKLLSYGR